MIQSFRGRTPILGEGSWVAPSAQVIGDVALGARSSVWFNTVVRADVMPIRIGADTNLQDLTMVHVTSGTWSCTVGDRVTVGHRVVLHGCSVGDQSLIGIGAILLDGVEVGSESMIGAGALVTPRTRIPSRVLAHGSPAKVIRPLTEAEITFLRENAAHYVEYANLYRSSP